MYRIRLVFRRFLKGLTLRGVNVLGLSLIFMCLAVSGTFIYRELSYDRFHAKAEQIVRLGIESDGHTFGARVYDKDLDKIPTDVPEVEQVTGLTRMNTIVLENRGEKMALNDVYVVSPDFFGMFDFPLLKGDVKTVLNRPGSVVVSRKMAQLLFGNGDAIDQVIKLSGRRLVERELVVTGVFEDMPENNHFHTDILVRKSEGDAGLSHVYLLLGKGAVPKEVEGKIADVWKKAVGEAEVKINVSLMPLTDIHLHSHQSGEMEPNGDVKYVYLLVSSNLLLLVIVLFNLWLNSKVLFMNNSKYYQLLKLNGASVWAVLADEAGLAGVLCCIAVGVGMVAAYYLAEVFGLSLMAFVSTGWFVGLLIIFVLQILLISVVPVVTKFMTQLFSSVATVEIPKRLEFSKMKYLLVVQYTIVMVVLVLMIGISEQIALIRKSQPAGEERAILVLDEQPGQVVARFDLLKEELLKHPEFSGATAAMSLPGGTLKDAIYASRFGSDEKTILSVLVADNDFSAFFHLKTLAGTGVLDYSNTWEEEAGRVSESMNGKKVDEEQKESYLINESAAKLLGFATPGEAVGKPLKLHHNTLSFVPYGTIAGVVEDFAYANVQEKVLPLVILCRKMNLYCFMVRMDDLAGTRGIQLFSEVWKKVNPEYPASYSMLQDVYGRVYRNELGAEKLLNYFSLLCLLIANIGLMVFVAFVIRKRTKEVGVRKVNGAGVCSVIGMLSREFLVWIGIAFVIAVPVSYYLLLCWLEGFNYRITVSWWFFVIAGTGTLVVALLTVGWQTWRAATANPVNALKSE